MMNNFNVCKKCRYDMNSYHCLDCPHHNGDTDGLMPFCRYCNNNNNCGNCTWGDINGF